MVAATASVAPAVTAISVSGSQDRSQNRRSCSAMACRKAGMPASGGYWFAPDASASAAAASISGGPSVSGKPWPRLIEPVATASADISATMVVPNGRMRATSGSAEVDVVTIPTLRIVLLEDELAAGHGGEGAVVAALRDLLAIDARPAADRSGVGVPADGGYQYEGRALHGGGHL